MSRLIINNDLLMNINQSFLLTEKKRKPLIALRWITLIS